MTIKDILEVLGISPAGGVLIVIVGVSALIEVSKIKINPWSAIAKGIRKALYGDLEQTVNDMRATQIQIRKDLSEHIAQSHRQAVIDFTTECMNGQRHTKEQFDYVFRSYRYYEQYVKDNQLTNDEVNESIEYIRRIYRTCLEQGDFD